MTNLQNIVVLNAYMNNNFYLWTQYYSCLDDIYGAYIFIYILT